MVDLTLKIGVYNVSLAQIDINAPFPSKICQSRFLFVSSAYSSQSDREFSMLNNRYE